MTIQRKLGYSLFVLVTAFVLLSGVAVACELSATISKTATPSVLDEPGGEVTFTVVVSNTSETRADLVSLMDNVYGDIADPNNAAIVSTTCELPVRLQRGGQDGDTYACSFTAPVTGDPGVYTDTVTALLTSNRMPEGITVSASASVEIMEVPDPPEELSATATKTANPVEMNEPGGEVVFTVQVTSTMAEDGMWLVGLTDDPFGSLVDPTNPLLLTNTCLLEEAIFLDPGEVFSCQFSALVTGDPGVYTDTVTATLNADRDEASIDVSASATVTILDVPDVGSLSGTVTDAVTELAIEGATVSLFGSGPDPLGTVTTADTGHYEFTGLLGDYTVEASHSLYSPYASGTITIPEGTNVVHDIELMPMPASVSGYVCEDLDNDGVCESGETRLSGVRIEAQSATGIVFASTVTDTNGDYAFTGLSAGAVKIVLDPASIEAGMGYGPVLYELSLAPNEAFTEANFLCHEAEVDLELTKSVNDSSVYVGNKVTFTLKVNFKSAHADNVAPFAATGVVVKDLLPANLTYVSHSGDGSYAKATGVWTVGDIDYLDSATLKIVVSVDKVATMTNVAEVTASDYADPDSTPGDGTGDDYATAKVSGVTTDGSAKIGDLVWFDEDADGRVDSGEKGLKGVKVTLTQGATTATATSDADGKYLFDDLDPGTYTVKVDVTTAPEGTVLTTVQTYTVTLSAGEFYDDADFGFSDKLPVTGFGLAGSAVAGALLLLLGGGLVVGTGRFGRRES